MQKSSKLKWLSIVLLFIAFACKEDNCINEANNFTIITTIAGTDVQKKLNYELEVIAKDAPLGVIQWTKKFVFPSVEKIFLPHDYNHYTLIARKAGFISHEQHFMREELFRSSQLSFEFIPESLEGFIKLQWEIFTIDGSVKANVYLPNSQNRCKLYARVDLPEMIRSDDDFMSVEMLASSIYGAPITEMKVSDDYQHNGWFRVNLFGNYSYLQAKDYCSEFDLEQQQLVRIPEHALISYNFFIETDGGFQVRSYESLPLIDPRVISAK